MEMLHRDPWPGSCPAIDPFEPCARGNPGPLPACLAGAEHVAIALGTFNGAAYLPAQLESLLRQTHRDWSLWIHDDGSTDGTWGLLSDFAARARGQGHHVAMARRAAPGCSARSLSGSSAARARAPAQTPAHAHTQAQGRISERAGVARAYHWLLSGPGPLNAPYTALCDQDDIWAPDRLARGVAGLSRLVDMSDPDKPAPPAMHSAAMGLIDAQGAPLGLSRPRAGAAPPNPGFAAALARCPTNAPTLLLTRAAMALLRRTPLPPGLASLDWWLVTLVLGCGGTLLHDPAETVAYRQHAGNTLGEAGTWRGIRNRLGLLASGDYRRWRDALVSGLGAAPLTQEARRVVAAYGAAPARGAARAQALRRAGLVRAERAERIIATLGAYCGCL
ncbi:MAG: glycosyltransferase [Pseudomonadota bacterium]